ncbi:hypothetical protein Tco_0280481 [Tanacetum coccineum]
MTTTATQQVALDNALKEPTYQVVLDALVLTTCYPAFLITADVPEIYMHPFWFTINKHDSSYRFKTDKKRFTLNMEVFREIFQICPRLLNQDFDELLSDEEIISFIKELGHKGNIKSITDVVVDQMHQSFVSKSKYFQVYEALLPEVMTNQKMRNSCVYKTYLAYATGAATPKKSRRFKKPASPSKKRTLVTIKGEEPKPAKKVLKNVIKRSKHETSIHQAGGSGNGTGSKLGVLDEPKGKSVNTNKGTRLKPRVPDVSKDDSSENIDDDPQQADDEQTDSENHETNDDEEEYDNKFVHTPPNYVPTDDETNDESNNVDEEEYDRIDKELYGDVNVRLTDAEQDNEGKEDADMTDVAHV